MIPHPAGQVTPTGGSRHFPQWIGAPWSALDAACVLGITLGLLLIASLVLYGIVGEPPAGESGRSLSPRGQLAAVLLQGALFMAVPALYGLSKYRSGLAGLGLAGWPNAGAYRYAIKAWLVALGLTIVYGFVVQRLGYEQLQPPDTAERLLALPGGLVTEWVVAALWAPLAEEILFRGCMMPGLSRKFGVGIGVILSAAIFGLFHFEPGAYGSVIPTFILGIALGLACAKSGSVWPSVGIHFVHNALVVIVTGRGL